MATGFGAAPCAKATVEVFDGTRQHYSGSEQLLITAIDGNQKTVSREFWTQPVVAMSLPFHDNLQDNYTFIAWAKGYKQAGITPVPLSPKHDSAVKLMLLPEDDQSAFSFAGATWKILKTARPKLAGIFAAGAANDVAAGNRYSDLEESGELLAALLNLTTSMGQIFLPQGAPLDYLKMVNFETNGDFHLARDRFFGWADPAIIPQLELAKAHHIFADAPAGLHPGATRSYKQIQFGEANLQLTFHENDRMDVGGINCVRIEPDIDYYKDPLSHLMLEVLVNAFGSISDPRTVCALRWIAGQRAGVPEFDPLYTIVPA
jgi:hypothetical protein